MFFGRLTLVLSCLLLQVLAFRFSLPSDDTAFEAGYGKHTGSEEDRLNRALWAGVFNSPYTVHNQKSNVITYKIRHHKRAQDPLIGFPNCLKCAGKRQFNAELDVKTDLSFDKLIREIKPNGLDGQCLFYGQRELGAQPPSLSGIASDLSCNWAKTDPSNDEKTRAIWDMWPQDREKSCETKTATTGYDYYCLDAWNPNCCWLNAIWKGTGLDILAPTVEMRIEREKRTRPYFQSMSRAMAETCVGDVYIIHEHYDLIEDYQPLGQNPSIWISDELPALRRRKLRDQVKRLWVIPVVTNALTGTLTANADRSTWKERTNALTAGAAKRYVEDNEGLAMYWKNFRELLKAKQREAAASPRDNSTQALEARWSDCRNGAAAQEAKGADYFG